MCIFNNERAQFYLCLCLAWVTFCVSLYAADSLEVSSTLPEITELEHDTLELQYWHPDENLWHEKAFLKHLKLDTRHTYKPVTEQLTSRIILSGMDKSTYQAFPRVHALFYQKVQQNSDPTNLAQIGLFVSHQNVLQKLSLGNFRLHVGEGLTLGSYQGHKSKADIIQPAQGLSHPALTGFAGHAQISKLDFVGWLSKTSRVAYINNSKIEKLYQSSLVVSDSKETALESTKGVVTGYFGQRLNLGGYMYQQSYNYDFADVDLCVPQHAYGFFGGYQHKPVSLGFESLLMQKKANRAVRLEYKTPELAQSFRFFYKDDTMPFAYARTEQIFGQQTGVEELSWDSITKPFAGIFITTRVAMVKALSGSSDSRWKERLIVSIRYKEQMRSTDITLYRFKKDALTTLDTLWADVLPTQHRIKAQVEQKLMQKLKYKTACQYQHFQGKKVLNNGFSMQHSLSFNTSTMDAHIAFIAWSNQKNLYQLTESLTTDELLIQADTDTALKLALRQKIGKTARLSLGIYRPLKHLSKQTYSLSISTL